jgi:hypothetical protein
MQSGRASALNKLFHIKNVQYCGAVLQSASFFFVFLTHVLFMAASGNTFLSDVIIMCSTDHDVLASLPSLIIIMLLIHRPIFSQVSE